jgi:cytochrome b561
LGIVAQSKIASVPVGYSRRQAALHWIVFVLVAFQFAIGNQMTHLFRAAHGGNPTRANLLWTPVHLSIGVLILLLMLARLALRRIDGVPPAPKQHPVLEWLAGAVHAGLYIDRRSSALSPICGCRSSPYGTGAWFAKFSSPCSRSISPARCGIGWSFATM